MGRGILATFGASVSLIAAGSLALFVVSAVIAFKGWPDIGDRTSTSRTTALAVVAADDHARHDGSKSIEIAAAPRRAPARSRERTATRTAPPQVAVVKRTAASNPPSRAPQAAASDGGALGDAPQEVEEDADVGDEVRETTSELGKATAETTTGLGEAVAPVSPELAESVDALGKVIDKTVTDVGETVDGLLDTLGRR